MATKSARTPRRRTSRKAPPRTDRVTAYALDVQAGRAPAGPHVRAACARHLRDLEEGPARGLTFDEAGAERAYGYFRDVLRLSGGDHDGKPFELQPWQAFVVGSLFGWKGADGSRRFRTAFVETAKGSGKSPLAAGIGMYGLTADGEQAAEIYAGAAKKDQAAVLFRDAVAMVDKSPTLDRVITRSGGKGREWNLAYHQTSSFFRPISTESQGRGQSGPRPHIGLLDEVHEHATNAMVEFMRAGTKGRRQPLIFMITNSGVDRTSVCFEYHEYGIRVCAGDLQDDTFFAYICAVDEDDDPLDPEKGRACWAKANPSLGITIQESYLEREVLSARSMPGKESVVRRLNFCQWVDAASPWVRGDLWRACEVGRPSEVEKGAPAWDPAAVKDRRSALGLDLSGRRDLLAVAQAWRAADDSVDAELFFWTPKDTLLERAREQRVPYESWVDKGHLLAPAGSSLDYRYPAQKVAELAARGAEALAFDPYRIHDFQRALDEEGVDSWLYEGPDQQPGTGIRLVKHGQGYAGGASEKDLWMPRSIEKLEELVLNGKLRVRWNPVLTWCSASAVFQTDPHNNRKWDKRGSKGKIDGIVALTMAVGLLFSETEQKPSVYEERGMISL